MLSDLTRNVPCINIYCYSIDVIYFYKDIEGFLYFYICFIEGQDTKEDEKTFSDFCEVESHR